MKSKFLIPFIALFAVLFLLGTTYSAWAFTNESSMQQIVDVEVPAWGFEATPLTTGTVIEIDEDGNVTINGETAGVTVNSEGDSYSNGDVTIKVEVDEDGNLVLSEFNATSTSLWALLGNTIYLPTSATIDGVTYPITGISQPLDIDVWSWLGTCTVYIPDTYTFICDDAFASLTSRATFEIPASIESIGSEAFMPARNVTQTINYAGTQIEWNAIDKSSNYENGRGSLTINYNS